MTRKPSWKFPLLSRVPILSRLQIKHQIYLVFCLTIVFPVLLLGLFTMRQITNVLYDRAYQQLESDNLRAKSILFDATLNFYTISTGLLEDRELQALLQEEYPDQWAAANACDSYNPINTTLVSNASISSIRIYSKNSTLPSTGNIQYSQDPQVNEWFDKVSIPGSVCWESSYSFQSGGEDSPELTMVRSFPFTSSQSQAILVIRMSNNYLKNRIQNNDFFISLSIDRDPIFFSTQRSLQGTAETAPIDYNDRFLQSSGEIDYNGKRVLSYISNFTPYMGDQSQLYFVSMDFNSPGYIQRFLGYTICLILIAIVVPCLVIGLFTRYFTKRIGHLKNAMHAAAQGDFSAIGPFQGDDELSVIFVDLQNVIANVQEQQAAIYSSQLKEQELINRQQQMEFKLLAGQINPHFIYNTLETIRMMALCDGARDVASATALFGKTMRYVLENTGTSQTTLEKELAYTENYLAIQKLRFDDKVNYTVETAEDLEASHCQILPLLLQPVVENAISHGLKESPRKGMIHIRVWSEEKKRLLLVVEDNGVGMSAQALEELREHIAGKDGEMVTSSIGLFNVYHRIKLFYGDEFGFIIESQEDRGTRVTLTLPLDLV